jgi:hypothetical protein
LSRAARKVVRPFGVAAAEEELPDALKENVPSDP